MRSAAHARLLTLAFLAVWLAGAGRLAAQDRMPPVAPERMSAAQREAAEELSAVRGYAPRGPWIPLLRSPEVLGRARALGDYLRFESALAPRLRELLILMTAREWTQQYEWHAHRPLALDTGLDPATVDAIAAGRRPAAMAEDEAILYALHSELQRNKGVSDATYAEAVAAFGEQGVIDAVAIVGYYTLLAMVMNTARTPLPEGALAPLP